MKKRKLLGEILLRKEYINEKQLANVLKIQKKEGMKLGEVLLNLGYVDQNQISLALAEQLGLKKVDLKEEKPEKEAIDLLEEDFARKHEIIPLKVKNDVIVVAMVDPLNVYAIDEINREIGLNVESVVATRQQVDNAINRAYGEQKIVEDILENIEAEEGSKLEEVEDGETGEDLASIQKMAGKAPIVKLVNSIILGGIEARASDIHIEPQRKRVRLRYRIDGVLIEKGTLPEGTKLAVISRVKIMAGLDIAERRIPQDGRISVKVKRRNVDLRCSTVPTVHGEKVVLRVIDPEAVISELGKLGMSPEMLEKFVELIESAYGMILLTGPTGSGKSSTLYAALKKINTAEDNIMTIEDPVESPVKGLNQVQINPKAGLTFANGLRSFLRQDPDIIMVGEIRDLETAEIGVHAALTGHLVFSTLHTNNSYSVVVRMTNMGIEPFLVSSSIIGAVSQRLVRRICDNCKEKIKPGKGVLNKFRDHIDDLEGKEPEFYKGKGCVGCAGTGYKGRIGIFEIFVLNTPIREAIITNKSVEEIKRIALDTGVLQVLREDGFKKVLAGITTLEEVLRVTQDVS